MFETTVAQFRFDVLLQSALLTAVLLLPVASLSGRVLRIPDASRSRTLQLNNRRLTPILLLNLCLTACPSLVSAQSKPTPPDALKAEKPDPEPNPTYHFHGKIVDPNGKPVAGATVHYTYWTWTDSITLGASNNEGIFDFSISPTDESFDAISRGTSVFAAVADGYGPALMYVRECETTGALQPKFKQPVPESAPAQTPKPGDTPTFQLVPDDVPLTGRVLDIDGRPVKGAILKVTQLTDGGRDELDAWEKAVRNPKPDLYQLRQHLKKRFGINRVETTFDFISPAVTDENGRFTLKGIGRDRIARLRISGPGIATGRAFARTRPGEIIEVPGSNNRPGSNTIAYQPAAFTYVAGPSVPVQGTVRDSKTKQPMAGVMLQSAQLAGHQQPPRWPQSIVQTVTDAEGRYRLEGLPIGENEILCLTDLDRPYIVSRLRIKTQSGDSELTKDVELTRGIWIEGRAYDQRTHEPITSGYVNYFPFPDNPFAKAVQGYHGPFPPERYRLNRDGTYRVPGLPGHGLVAVRTIQDTDKYLMGMGTDKIEAEVRGRLKIIRTYPVILVAMQFHVLREVNPPEDAKTLRVDFPFDSGQSLKVSVVDQDGNPVSGGQYSGRMDRFTTWRSFRGHELTINAYRPENPRRVQVFQQDRKLAGYLLIDGKDPHDLKITLQPWAEISGRLLDPAGVPQSDFIMHDSSRTPLDDDPKNALLPPKGIQMIKRGSRLSATDNDGRFKIVGLMPGKPCKLIAFQNRKNGRTYILGEFSLDGSLKPGESRDLGDVQLKR